MKAPRAVWLLAILAYLVVAVPLETWLAVGLVWWIGDGLLGLFE